MPREKVEVAAAEPVEPWRSFLRDLDAALKGSMELRCLGGFVNPLVDGSIPSRSHSSRL